MVEFPQTSANLTEASSNLFEAVKGANLVVYPADDLRLAISRSVAIETPRGWKIVKEKASHKIDITIALSMAALAAAKGADDYEGLQGIYRRANEANRAFKAIAGEGAPGWMRAIGNAKCAKCAKPLPPNSLIVQSRGLKFCSQACAW